MAQIVKLRRSSVSGQKPTNSNLQLGELALNTTDGKVFLAKSGSLGPSVEELVSTNTTNTGSINLIGDITASGNISGSFIGDGSGLYNIPSSGVTGLELNKIVSGSVSASISPNRGLEVNTSVNLGGSVFDEHKITGSVTIYDNLTLGAGDKSSSVIFRSVISSSLLPDSDGVHHFIGSPFRRWESVHAFTGSFNHIEGWSGQTVTIQDSVITGSFTGSFIGDGSGLYNLPYSGLTDVPPLISGSLQISELGFTTTSSFENFTSSVVLTSQTGSMTVLSASYAVTAAFALSSLGGGDSQGRTAIYEQTTPSTGWTFNHYLGEKYPAISVFDSNDNIIVPTNINAVDDNTLTLTFTSPVSGVVSATVGGGLPSISQSYDGRVLAVENDGPTWKTGILSGSLQISNLGYAITGSNTFGGSQTINGDLVISDSIVKQITATGLTTNTNIIMLPTSSYNGGFFDYIVKDGTNFRAGNIMTIFNGNTVKFTETSTNDIGDTTPVTISVAQSNGNITLNTQISSGTWTIKVLSRGI